MCIFLHPLLIHINQNLILQGDSGGPLQITSPNNDCVFYVVGITSFGKVCGAARSPGVYTRVSSFIPWIESIVW